MKKYLTIVLLCMFTAFGADAQSQAPGKDYLDKVFKPVSKRKAEYSRTFDLHKSGRYVGTIRDKKKRLRMTGEYIVSSAGDITKHGKFTFYYPNGQVESVGLYESDMKVGSWKRFTVDGTQRPDRYYSPESVEFLREIMAGS